jgi:hypothetical protein
MYELKRLVEGVFFEVLNQLRDSVGVGPGFAPVVAGPESVGIVSLTNKGAVVSTNFFIAGLKQPVSEARMDSLMTHFWAGLSELSLIAATA